MTVTEAVKGTYAVVAELVSRADDRASAYTCEPALTGLERGCSGPQASQPHTCTGLVLLLVTGTGLLYSPTRRAIHSGPSEIVLRYGTLSDKGSCKELFSVTVSFIG
ncbi:unnamed protein product [Pleuronectes platessa]|uniref:Uncharacterized protein n=1 Tax=Pleuronectes platessa TaxID=8262 RepID=A0A9N7YAB9_PLEPL|nr:unnamed protein product [Pleuronectes platessa]